MSKRLASAIVTIANVLTTPMNDRQRNKTFGRVITLINRNGFVNVALNRGNIKFLNLRGSGVASAAASVAKGENEPETREWIDNHIKSGDTLWDIGANIGVFSMYAALDSKVNVLAFEPSSADFSTLIEHISVNNMSKNLKAFCLALSGETKLETLYMSRFEAGCGGSAIGEPVVSDEAFEPLFEQAIPAITGDDFCAIFKAPQPDHIKLDVDGIEGEILRGMKNILPKVKTLLVEVERSNVEHVAERIEAPLFAAGFEENTVDKEKYDRNRLYINKNFK